MRVKTGTTGGDYSRLKNRTTATFVETSLSKEYTIVRIKYRGQKVKSNNKIYLLS